MRRATSTQAHTHTTHTNAQTLTIQRCSRGYRKMKVRSEMEAQGGERILALRRHTDWCRLSVTRLVAVF
jgi:hypothetical protein